MKSEMYVRSLCLDARTRERNDSTGNRNPFLHCFRNGIFKGCALPMAALKDSGYKVSPSN